MRDNFVSAACPAFGNEESVNSSPDKLKTALTLGWFAAGWALLFLLVTAGLSELRAPEMIMGGLAAGSLLMGLFFVRGGLVAPANVFRDLVRAVSAGGDTNLFFLFAAGLWASFALQIIKRYTAAPSGADTVFMLAAAPVIALAYTSLDKEKLGWGRAVGLIAALAGGAMIVANWESPSSFSPFVLFPLEELYLVLSAAGLAVFAAAGHRLVKKYEAVELLAAAFWIVTPLYAVAWVVTGGLRSAASVAPASWRLSAVIGVAALAFPLLALLSSLKTVPPTRALTAVSVMPVLVTALIVVERAFGFAALPAPFAWPPVAAGIVVVIAGVIAAWLV
jgi:drug/metabolite transporter (DMT)-like permease